MPGAAQPFTHDCEVCLNMVAYVVEQLDDVTLSGGPLSEGMDLMSPFV